MTHILVPVDASAASAAVVDAAGTLASGLDGMITLLAVAPRQPDLFGQQLVRKVIEEPVPDDLRDRYTVLQELARRLADRGIPCDTLMVRGAPVNRILSEAKRLGAGIIVMGSHGRGALYRNLMGSVSEGILRAGPCPLLIIPASRGGTSNENAAS